MFLKHYVSRLVTSDGRGSSLDPCACPLLPGGLGQWVAEALQLATTVPYLLLWSYVMAMEGTPPVLYLSLLESLGYLPGFRWTSCSQGRKIVTPVRLDGLSVLLQWLIVLANWLFISGGGSSYRWAGQRIAFGSSLSRLRSRCRWLEGGPVFVGEPVGRWWTRCRCGAG